MSAPTEAATLVKESQDTSAKCAPAASHRGKAGFIGAGVFIVVLAAGLGGYLLRPAPDVALEPPSEVPREGTVDTDSAGTAEPTETVVEESPPSSALETAEAQLSALKEQLSELKGQREQVPSDADSGQSTDIDSERVTGEEELAALAAETARKQQEEEAARKQQEEEEHRVEIERQNKALLQAQREQEEAERKAVEEAGGLGRETSSRGG